MAACGGLHCAGCIGGLAVPVVPLLEAYGVVWVVEHIYEVAAVSAVCGALAVAIVVALMRRGDRRDARQRGAASIWTVRPGTLPPRRQAAVGPAERAALPFRDLHLHFDASTTAEQAAVIRRALGGG